MDCSPLGSSVHGILQARILEWVAIPFSRGSSWPREGTHISYIGRQIFYHWATRQNPVWFMYTLTIITTNLSLLPTTQIVLHLIPLTHGRKKEESEVIQSYLTLCHPMDSSLPGFSVHGIFQTRILEWVAISFSRAHDGDPGV